LDYQCNEKFGNFLGNRIGNLPIDIKANLLMSKIMKIIDYHKISYFLVSFDTLKVGVAGSLSPYTIYYISIIYKLKKQSVSRFVDRTINDLKINYFTYWFYKDKYYLVLK
tara:strand:- start:2927 stop:3256 length:330 start_codon:yes stop_codon:yes gene_type:complete